MQFKSDYYTQILEKVFFGEKGVFIIEYVQLKNVHDKKMNIGTHEKEKYFRNRKTLIKRLMALVDVSFTFVNYYIL